MARLFALVFVLHLYLINAWKSECHDESFNPDAILRISASDTTLGCVARNSALVNRTSPGPALHFRQGSTVWVRVWNDLSDKNLTMHWHGLSQAAAPFSDGTPQASQWPIPPGHFFDYELSLQDVTAGTYFYHSHVGFQSVSVSGPLIITERERPYEYDGERIVFLSDVFNKTDSTIESGLLGSPFHWSGETNALLFNGVGASRSSENTPGSGCGISEIRVKPGVAYRFRFIGATALSMITIGIQAHSFNIIEADGAYTQAHPVDFLQIASGQRYSSLFQAKTCDELRADGTLQYYIQGETRERPTLTIGYAILKYDNDCGMKSNGSLPIPSQPPLTLPSIQRDYLEYALRPLEPNGFPSASEVTRRVTMTVQQIVGAHIIWQQNMYAWFGSPTPYLVALYQNASNFLPDYDYALQHNGIDDRVGAFPAKIGEVIEIVIQNSGATTGKLDVHPFHAHGAHYYDIGSGNGSYDAQANEARLATSSPVLRDTTMLYRYGTLTTPGAPAGWRAWRLRVTQPGVWMIHCHILQHMIMGMQTVWVMGNETDVLKLPKIEAEGYLTYGGSVFGNDTHQPWMMASD